MAQTYGSGSNGDYFAYDVLGRATLKIQQTGSVNYQLSAAYNLSGAISTMTYPSGHTVTNSYDQAGRLTALSGNLGDGATRTYATGILYSPTGGLVKEQFGTTTPVYNKLFYNSRGQLAEIRASTSYTGPTDTTWDRGAIINSYSSQCTGVCSGSSMSDNNGNLLKQQIYIPGHQMRWQQYDYDSLNRLNWAREVLDGGAEQWKQQFTYDRWGNRTIDTAVTYGIGINNKAFTVNTVNNRLGVPGGQSGVMTYDAAGNLTNDTYTGAGNRTYDAENKITSAWGGNNQEQLYSYDASGQRIKRTVYGVETWQVYGFGAELLAEYPANGPVITPTKEYGYRNGQLLVTAESATSAPVNVAWAANGATATASSAYTGFAASGAINGDRRGLFVGQDGYWSTAGTGPAWLEVQFNGSKTISEIDIITVQDNYMAPVEPTEAMTFSSYGLSGYDVQYWNNSAWVTITGGSVSGNNKVWRKFTFTPLTTTRIRVACNASPDGFSRLIEVEAWTGPSPAPRYNLALGATATASSSAAPGWGPSGVVNGDRKSLNWGNGGGWADATPVNSFPDWLQVDFGANQTIAEIDVFTLQDNYAGSSEPTESMTFTQWGLTGYAVQYWDGSNWVQVPGASVTGNNKIWRKFTFSPIITSKLRVLTNAAADGYSRLTEIEAYAPVESGGAGGVNWLVTDHLGTPRMVFDETGNLNSMKRHDYLPFGEELVAPTSGRSAAQGYTDGDGVRQQFTQQERDIELGLDYFGARYYGSMQGRFTGADPGPFTPADPQNFNRYSYVQNNPLKFIDPTGRELTFVGADAEYIVSELARITGISLVIDLKTGKVTIDKSKKRNMKGTSTWFANKLMKVIRDSRAKIKIATVRNHPRIFIDDYDNSRLDVGDYNVLKAADPKFAAAALAHVIAEYYHEQVIPITDLPSTDEVPAGGGRGPLTRWGRFDESHEEGLDFESKVLSDYTGWWEQPAERKDLVNTPEVRVTRVEYSSVSYDVVRTSTSVHVVKNEKQKPRN